MKEPLAALGLGSRAVELPSCVPPQVASVEPLGDMYDDAGAVRAALDEEDEPVVLVGHSYGGVVITDAAAGQETVKHLVYVTSVMPELDEALSSFGGSELGPWMNPRPEDGTMGVKAELVPDAFMQDCDEEAIAGGLKRLTRQSLAVFGQTPRGVAGEAFDLRGVRRGPRDPARSAARVRQEGGFGRGTADRSPPVPVASRTPGPDTRRSGGHTKCLTLSRNP